SAMERSAACRLAALAVALAAPQARAAPQVLENPDASAVLAEVNRVRTERGLSPVKPDPALMAAASGYAAELTTRPDLDHIGRDGSTPPVRAEKAGYVGGNVAENLAAGFADPTDAVEAWMKSPSHRDVILKPDAEYAGVAREDAPETEYKSYWTMLVGGPEKAGGASDVR
ncbi:MAG: CAP domain-containing protein, partial [Parvularculaceae bacterium]|nr:CAP domain-containing protein [Parvularculaceae bacterium]